MTSQNLPSDKKRIIVFGEVLFDVFPDGRKVAGGAPYNVARHLAALGQDPLFVSRVGDDAPGRTILDGMRRLGMDRAGVGVDGERPTGVVEVRMEDDGPRYDIVTDVAWDHIQDPGGVVGLLLYHGSLALRSAVSAATLAGLSGAPRFVDLNLRPPWYDAVTVLDCVGRADSVKVNVEEMRELGAMLGLPEEEPEDLATRIVARTGLRTLYVTDGEAGAWAVTRDGRCVRVPVAATDAPVRDTVGAGDAFCAVCLCGEVLGWELGTTLARAALLAARICTIQGAFPETMELHAPLAAQWGLTT